MIKLFAVINNQVTHESILALWSLTQKLIISRSRIAELLSCNYSTMWLQNKTQWTFMQQNKSQHYKLWVKLTMTTVWLLKAETKDGRISNIWGGLEKCSPS